MCGAETSNTNDGFVVKLTCSNFDIVRSFLDRINLGLKYKVDSNVMVNALLASGSFDLETAAIDIARSFTAPLDPVSHSSSFRINLSSNNLDLCRSVQKDLRPFFHYKPDINMVVNSFLASGSFDDKKILEHITHSFVDILRSKL